MAARPHWSQRWLGRELRGGHSRGSVWVEWPRVLTGRSGGWGGSDGEATRAGRGWVEWPRVLTGRRGGWGGSDGEATRAGRVWVEWPRVLTGRSGGWGASDGEATRGASGAGVLRAREGDERGGDRRLPVPRAELAQGGRHLLGRRRGRGL